MRGRKRKPAELKKLTGSRTRTAKEKTLEAPAGRPACPEWMSEEAKAIWWRALTIAPWLREADEQKLINFCELSAEIRWAIEDIKKNGRLFKSRMGDEPNPAISIRNKAITLHNKIGSDLGFDPAMRARMVASDAPEKKQEEEEFFAGPRLVQSA